MARKKKQVWDWKEYRKSVTVSTTNSTLPGQVYWVDGLDDYREQIGGWESFRGILFAISAIATYVSWVVLVFNSMM